MNNELAQTNPVAQKIFNEIWEDALFPSTTLSGNAIDTVGYISNGEANDFIMRQYDIPSVSPELGNDSVYSGDFFIWYDFAVRDILKDNASWIEHTFRKLSGELRVNDDNYSGGKTKFFYWRG